MMDGPWQVLRQRETIEPNEVGSGFTKVVEVTFRTAGNVIGTVNVPRDGYTADSVRAAVDKHAAELDAVANL